MIRSLPGAADADPARGPRRYLPAGSRSAVLELARRPQLLPVFLRLIAMAPRTVAELQRRRAA